MALPEISCGGDSLQIRVSYICEYIEQALTDSRQNTHLRVRVEEGETIPHSKRTVCCRMQQNDQFLLQKGTINEAHRIWDNS